MIERIHESSARAQPTRSRASERPPIRFFNAEQMRDAGGGEGFTPVQDENGQRMYSFQSNLFDTDGYLHKVCISVFFFRFRSLAIVD